jgi:hypothetical protein
MQNIDSAVSVERCPRERETALGLRDIGFANEAIAAFRFDHRLCFANRFQISINQNQASAFSRKEHGRGAAIANSVSWRLPRAYDYGGFVFKSHDSNRSGKTFLRY